MNLLKGIVVAATAAVALKVANLAHRTPSRITKAVTLQRQMSSDRKSCPISLKTNLRILERRGQKSMSSFLAPTEPQLIIDVIKLSPIKKVKVTVKLMEKKNTLTAMSRKRVTSLTNSTCHMKKVRATKTKRATIITENRIICNTDSNLTWQILWENSTTQPTSTLLLPSSLGYKPSLSTYPTKPQKESQPSCIWTQ